MRKIETGGPAFPFVTTDWHEQGMTLRDWFAGQLLAGSLLDQTGAITDQGIDNEEVSMMVRAAYVIADAMIAERNNGEHK